MVMQVLLTTDTEMSSALHGQGVSAAENYARSIDGRCTNGQSWGVGYQLDELQRWGLQTVFFIDPMPVLVYGPQLLADIVGPIVERGHEAQLHIHTEWLAFAPDSPVDGRTGRNIADFSRDDQRALLALGRDLLIEAGAPRPIAFRAGNYGANDDTLHALADVGIAWDSSYNAACLGGDCQIDLPPHVQDVTERHGVRICPIGMIEDRRGTLRHAQLCALSGSEMKCALLHGVQEQADFFNIVSHSFELYVRNAQRGHPLNASRFRSLCRTIAEQDGLVSGGFHRLGAGGGTSGATPLPAHLPRRAMRMAMQAGARLLIE